jgi:putative addiction module component (TIGR02574 family)
MNTRIRAITEEAARLPASDRVRLVEHLLATLDKPDSEIDRAWVEESERRLDSYLRGASEVRDGVSRIEEHPKAWQLLGSV